MFDFFSLIHFGMWSFVANTIAATWEPPLWVHILYTLIAGYSWEGFEYFAQRKWPAKWSHRIEPWTNSWVGDIIANCLGSAFGWFVVAYYRKNYKIL